MSSAGITTNVITELATGNNGAGGAPARALYNLLFNPSVTLPNNTNNALSYSFIYDLTFNANVNAIPNGGTALSNETVSNFPQSLTSTNGFFSNNPGQVPGQLTGTAVIQPHVSTMLAFITRIEGDTQYVPPVKAAAAPEPSTLPLLGTGLTLGAGVAGGVKRREAR